MKKDNLLKEIYKLEKSIKRTKLSSKKSKLKITQFHLLKEWKSLKVKDSNEVLKRGNI